MDPPRPTLQNPLKGTTIDTSPSALHLHTEHDESSSNVVDRLVRKASQVKKSGHRKLHSLSLRARSPKSDEGELQPGDVGHAELRRASCQTRPRNLRYVADDGDSPKVQEKDRVTLPTESPADSKPSSHPSLNSLSFRGEGSV
jgi:hypothetical protein